MNLALSCACVFKNLISEVMVMEAASRLSKSGLGWSVSEVLSRCDNNMSTEGPTTRRSF